MPLFLSKISNKNRFIILNVIALFAINFFTWANVAVRPVFGREPVSFNLFGMFNQGERIGSVLEFIGAPVSLGTMQYIFGMLAGLYILAFLLIIGSLFFKERTATIISCAGFAVVAVATFVYVRLFSMAGRQIFLPIRNGFVTQSPAFNIYLPSSLNPEKSSDLYSPIPCETVFTAP